MDTFNCFVLSSLLADLLIDGYKVKLFKLCSESLVIKVSNCSLRGELLKQLSGHQNLFGITSICIRSIEIKATGFYFIPQNLDITIDGIEIKVFDEATTAGSSMESSIPSSKSFASCWKDSCITSFQMTIKDANFSLPTVEATTLVTTIDSLIVCISKSCEHITQSFKIHDLKFYLNQASGSSILILAISPQIPSEIVAECVIYETELHIQTIVVNISDSIKCWLNPSTIRIMVSLIEIIRNKDLSKKCLKIPQKPFKYSGDTLEFIRSLVIDSMSSILDNSESNSRIEEFNSRLSYFMEKYTKKRLFVASIAWNFAVTNDDNDTISESSDDSNLSFSGYHEAFLKPIQLSLTLAYLRIEIEKRSAGPLVLIMNKIDIEVSILSSRSATLNTAFIESTTFQSYSTDHRIIEANIQFLSLDSQSASHTKSVYLETPLVFTVKGILLRFTTLGLHSIEENIVALSKTFSSVIKGKTAISSLCLIMLGKVNMSFELDEGGLKCETFSNRSLSSLNIYCEDTVVTIEQKSINVTIVSTTLSIKNIEEEATSILTFLNCAASSIEYLHPTNASEFNILRVNVTSIDLETCDNQLEHVKTSFFCLIKRSIAVKSNQYPLRFQVSILASKIIYSAQILFIFHSVDVNIDVTEQSNTYTINLDKIVLETVLFINCVETIISKTILLQRHPDQKSYSKHKIEIVVRTNNREPESPVIILAELTNIRITLPTVDLIRDSLVSYEMVSSSYSVFGPLPALSISTQIHNLYVCSNDVATQVLISSGYLRLFSSSCFATIDCIGNVEEDFNNFGFVDFEIYEGLQEAVAPWEVDAPIVSVDESGNISLRSQTLSGTKSLKKDEDMKTEIFPNHFTQLGEAPISSELADNDFVVEIDVGVINASFHGDLIAANQPVTSRLSNAETLESKESIRLSIKTLNISKRYEYTKKRQSYRAQLYDLQLIYLRGNRQIKNILYRWNRYASREYVLVIKALSSHDSLTISIHSVNIQVAPLRLFLDASFVEFLELTKAEFVVKANTLQTPEDQQQLDSFCIYIHAIRLKLDFHCDSISIKKLGRGDKVQLLSIFPIEGMEIELSEVHYRREPKSIFNIIEEILYSWKHQINQITSFTFLQRTSELKNLSAVLKNVMKLITNISPSESVLTLASKLEDTCGVCMSETLDFTQRILSYGTSLFQRELSASILKASLNTKEAAGMNIYMSCALTCFQSELSESMMSIGELQRADDECDVEFAAKHIFNIMMRPISGVASAFSVTLLGLRHQIDQDAREEYYSYYPICAQGRAFSDLDRKSSDKCVGTYGENHQSDAECESYIRI